LKSTRIILLTLLAVAALAAPVVADEIIWTSGKAVGPDGKPVKGLVVVVYDDKDKIVDYAYTDEQGEYALAIPEGVLNLDTKRSGGGFLASVTSKVKRFVTAQVEGIADGAKTAIMALTTAQSGLLAAPVAKAALDSGTRVAATVERRLKPQDKKAAEDEAKKALKQPGALYLKASAPGFTDFAGIAHLYWIQRETNEVDGKKDVVFASWIDTLSLTAANSGKPSTIGSNLLKFTAASAAPSIVPPGGKLTLTATIPAPPEPKPNLIVIARSQSGQTWILNPDKDNIYSAEIAFDEKTPSGDQIISLLAYAVGDAPGRRKDAENEIEKAGMWDLKKEFVPNPLLAATRNRADIKVTVLPIKKQK
jgi:hypothetical protein